jgi:hypothetical protein
MRTSSNRANLVVLIATMATLLASAVESRFASNDAYHQNSTVNAASTRQAEQKHERGRRSNSNVEMVNVVVGMKPAKHQEVLSTMTHEDGTVMTIDVGTIFRRTHAVTMSVPASQVEALLQNPNVHFVEADAMAYPHAETQSWGLRAVQADSATIPLPSTTSPCLKICIVDSGLMVDHPDIVSLACLFPPNEKVVCVLLFGLL